MSLPRLRDYVPAITEAALQGQLVTLYVLAGFEVCDLSQGYRPQPGGTRQTAGLTDLELWHLPSRTLAKHEVKTPAGLLEHWALLEQPLQAQNTKAKMKKWRRAQAQAKYRALCLACDVPYAIGGTEAAKELIARVTGRVWR